MNVKSRSEGVVLVVSREDLARALLTIAPFMSGYNLDDFEVNNSDTGRDLHIFYEKRLPPL